MNLFDSNAILIELEYVHPIHERVALYQLLSINTAIEEAATETSRCAIIVIDTQNIPFSMVGITCFGDKVSIPVNGYCETNNLSEVEVAEYHRALSNFIEKFSCNGKLTMAGERCSIVL